MIEDRETLARQYRDDANLRARQRLWQISPSEPPFDFNTWSVGLIPASGPGAQVLDAGCGNGLALRVLRDRGYRAVGLDLSIGMAHVAGPPVAAGSVEMMPFPDGVFDAAAAFMMMYHVSDQLAAVAELRRVIRPGGTLVVTTASTRNVAEFAELVESAVGGGWRWTTPSAVAFSLESGAAVLGTAFEVVDIVPTPDRQVRVSDAEALAAYVASTDIQTTLPPNRSKADVVTAVRDAAQAVIDADGAVVFTPRAGAFICR